MSLMSEHLLAGSSKTAAVLSRPIPASPRCVLHGQRRLALRGPAYSLPYAGPLSDARVKLADFFNSLLEPDNGVNGKLKPRSHGLLPVAFLVLPVPDGER